MTEPCVNCALPTDEGQPCFVCKAIPICELCKEHLPSAAALVLHVAAEDDRIYTLGVE